MEQIIEGIYENGALSSNQASKELLEVAKRMQLEPELIIDELELYELPDYEALETLFYYLLEKI